MLQVSSIFSGLDWSRENIVVAISAAALLGGLVRWLIDHQRKRRQVSYRVHMNEPVGATPDMRGTGDFAVRRARIGASIGKNDVAGGAQLKGGRVIREVSGNVPSRRTLLYAGPPLVAVGVLIGLAVFRSAPGNDNNAQCVDGSITVVGSTAFAPTVSKIAEGFKQKCPRSTVIVNATGSNAGINDLDPSKQSSEAAMYDGMVDQKQYHNIIGKPIATISFAVVVNNKIGVSNLSVADLRRIFSDADINAYTNWNQIKQSYPNLPIHIIGRDSQSGTRDTFIATVLGGKAERGQTSKNCVNTSDPGQARIICELSKTPAMLNQVNNIEGAIGYAEIPPSNMYPNVDRIQIDNRDPDIRQDIYQGKQPTYPFWTNEHIYTYGTPASGSLLSAFLKYLNTPEAENVMQQNGDIPCAEFTGNRK